MRHVAVADALGWLPQQEPAPLAAVLPDMEEVGLNAVRYLWWLRGAAGVCFAAAQHHPVVMVITDRRIDGGWISKAHELILAAEFANVRLTVHRIVLRRPPGAQDLKRPTYSHMLCFGGRPGNRTADVFHGGKALWRNGVGVAAAREAIWWLCENGAESVLNPFCGHGTLLAAAEERGLEARGCDVDPERAGIAQHLRLPAAVQQINLLT